MSTLETGTGQPFRPQAATLSLLGSAAVATGIFLSGFVISEPAPYELFMAGLVGLWFLLGLKISRSTSYLLTMLIVLEIGCMLSLTQMRELSDGPMYLAVNIFLALTAVFYAAIIEERHSRLTLIFNFWTLAALITGTLGILGYFHAFPGAEVFTLYDRAKGAFQDPNVFGPFLVAPSLYLLYGILKDKLGLMTFVRGTALMILAMAVLLSFSRAAWGLYAFANVMLVMVMLLKERTSAFRLKVLVLAMLGFVLLVTAFAIAIQFSQVSDMLADRSQLVKPYDAGHLGRFDRHRIGFLLSMEHPLGIGPLLFGKIYGEDEHNTWLKMLTTYGWLGFVTYITMLFWTLSIGFKYMLRNRPWQPFLMIAWITLLGHALIGNVIDTDHWRHFYLLYGIIWGCRALEHNFQRALRRSAAV
ncbi:O-antigen ligase [Rhizobium sp. L1K21]|uniref:O-antigen ligase family protein n=1 Tax=Rhizobium sp. L1K21 TaxID=2954933 RepID=UPI00209357E4|nr:O-antigen ligase family protein [Rhizobium sp. L1K21]MCO6185838.1 O-antigen ligase family protein [Rhizobium sp. L1K21]